MGRRITALQVQKRNPQRVNVYLDGEFAFGLWRIVAAWLQVGQELSDEKIAALQREEERETAYQLALKLLNHRSRSEMEVRRKLEERSLSAETIDAALERLRRAGLLDDERFAHQWIENRAEFRPRSRRALAFEMRQRGLPEETIHKALQGVSDEELAYQAAVSHARKIRTREWADFRQKLSGFLARRGFSYQLVAPTVKRVWQEIQMHGNAQATDFANDEG